MTPKVNDELKNYLPELKSEERAALEESIKEVGCREPIKIWSETGFIVDGHNRYEICEANSVSYKVEEISFDVMDDAKQWMCRNQLGRRNMTDSEFKLVLGRLFNQLKVEKSGRKAAEELSKEHDVSTSSVQRAGRRADAVDAAHEEGDKELADELAKAPERAYTKQTENLDERKQEVEKVKNGSAVSEAPSKKDSVEKFVESLTRNYVSPLVRGIDRIATMNGGKGKRHEEANTALEQLLASLKEMKKGKQ